MKPRIQLLALGLLALAALTGCDKFTDYTRGSQEVTKRAYEDTKASWTDFFTYHPRMADALPQTRYCYQMQSDVVCYDSEQRVLTSKLMGYQDGENISWVQPGGGSLGASGGEAYSYQPRREQNLHLTKPQDVGKSTAQVTTVATSRGQIDVIALPPPQPVVPKNQR